MHLFDDEDGSGTIAFDDPHNPTVYLSGAEMRHFESIPYDEPPEKRIECCGSCQHFDGDYCTKWWNNGEKPAVADDIDKVDVGDWCEDWETNEEDEDATDT